MSTARPYPVSRRGFLAGGAALSVGALLARQGWADAEPYFRADGIDVAGLERNGYRIRHTICHQCGAGCGLTALARADEPAGAHNLLILPNQHPDHPQRGYCGRGATTMFTWNSPLRVKNPLKRVGPRGSGTFEEISWNQALDEIAERIKGILERDGARALAATTHDFATDLQWLMWPLGAPNIVKQSSTCNTAGVVGRKWLMGKSYSKHSTIDPDYERVNYVLFPGRSLNAPMGAVQRLAQAREKGAKVVFLNPAMPDVAFANGEWLACYPGTDAAFMLGVARVLVEEGRYDATFVRQHTNLPFLIHEDGKPVTEADLTPEGSSDRYAMWDATRSVTVLHDEPDANPDLTFEGTIPGRNGPIRVETAWRRFETHLADYGADRVAEITGIPARDVVRIARELAEMNGVVEDTWYNTRNGNDTDVIMALMTVNGLLGNIDQPGGLGFKPSAKLPGILSNADGRATTILGDGFDLSLDPSVDKLRYPETNGTFAAVLDAILDEDPYPITGMILLGATLFHRDPNTRRLEQALEKLDLLVNIDVVRQEVDDWSDYVLPSEMFLERENVSAVGWTLGASVARQHRITPPPEGVDARPHEWIMLEILRRIQPERALMFGYDERYADPEVFHRDFLAPLHEARIDALADAWQRNPEAMRTELDEHGFVTLAEPTFGRLPYETPFGTPSGRFEIYALEPILKGYRSDGFAQHVAPNAYTLPGAEDELYLVNGKSPIGSSGVASMAFSSQYLADNALWLHPDDAARLGIADGDDAEVEGLDTGWLAKTHVRVTPRVRAGVAYIQSYVGGNRGSALRENARFAKLTRGLNPHWFSTSTVDPVTGSNANNASIRIRRA